MIPVEEFRGVLKRHVIDPWFPRCVDREYGGFLCDFDRRWRSCGPHEKLLEFQARHTLLAADAARHLPDDRGLHDAAMHGFRFLRDVLWDTEHGGWFHSVDRAGKPLEHLTKHTHGFAYALSACASVYELTRDEGARALAQAAFDWMDRFARDPEHGGYFGYLRRDGTVIHTPAQSPNGQELDTVGTEVGFKDLNVHSDLLETFALMYRVWREPRIGERLAESIEIIGDRMVNPTTGSMHFFVTPDWRPVPHLIRVGYQSHSAYRLILALGLTGHDALIRRMAAKLVNSAIRYARDSNGDGYYYAAPGALPTSLHDHEIRVSRRTWWVQMEALKALLAVSSIAPDAGRYLRLFEDQWRYIRKHFLDETYGGVYMHGLDNVRIWERKFGARLAPMAITRKGDVWKDASHEGRALLYCIERSGAPAT
jgi:mannobiose 2-epimerase